MLKNLKETQCRLTYDKFLNKVYPYLGNSKWLTVDFNDKNVFSIYSDMESFNYFYVYLGNNIYVQCYWPNDMVSYKITFIYFRNMNFKKMSSDIEEYCKDLIKK